METLNTFLGTAIGTIIIGLLCWIGNQLWSLKKQAILDRAKLDIDVKKLEHEVRFKKVYDKISDILVELAPMLTSATKDFRTFINDLEWSDAPSKADRWTTAATSYNDTRAFLHDNRLLIPKPLFNLADDLIKALKVIIDKFHSGRRNAERRQDAEQYEDYTASAEEAVKALEPRYLAIHDAMQTYLGVPTE